MFLIFADTNSREWTSVQNFAGINFHDSRKKIIKHFLKWHEFENGMIKIG